MEVSTAWQSAYSVVVTNFVYSMASWLTQLVLVIPSLTPFLFHRTVDPATSEVKLWMLNPVFWYLNLGLSTVSWFYK